MRSSSAGPTFIIASLVATAGALMALAPGRGREAAELRHSPERVQDRGRPLHAELSVADLDQPEHGRRRPLA